MKVRKTNKSGPKKWEVDLGKINGKRQRKFFPTAARARGYLRAKQREADNLGIQTLAISHQDRTELLAAKQKLNGAGTITEAVDFFLLHRQKVTPRLLTQAMDDCRQAKQRTGKRKRYLQVLKSTFRGFALTREHKYCHDITPKEIEEWVTGNGWAVATQRGRLIDLHTLFAWCQRQGYCSANPAAKVERPDPEEKEPCALSLPDIKKLLGTGLNLDPEATGGYIAPVLFGGLRPEADAQRLASNQVRKTIIKIHGHKGKTRKTRNVEITPQLRAWMKLCPSWPIRNLKRRILKIRKAAGIGWPHDCLRHSFCSYMTAARGARWTAENAGHSEDVLYSKYREEVLKPDAISFSRLTPARLRR